ncbi:hypothetical protein AVEN_283-1 [Araneus ventricosus]|uniref:Uncharacterized protein n=1 Tax=Araneus ventricosus TaxID=182803 RepID=A0A4Y2CN70_ARAVE|nr:hypothetical protein AVEN_283-1 [Araneus ventricosus]
MRCCKTSWVSRRSKACSSDVPYNISVLRILQERLGMRELYRRTTQLKCRNDLISKMKEPLCGIGDGTVPEILKAIGNFNEITGTAAGIIWLSHRWPGCAQC